MPNLDTVKLDTSTEDGLNVATALAVFRLELLDLKITQKRTPGGVLVHFEWTKDAAFTGSVGSADGVLSVGLRYEAWETDPITHAVTEECRTSTERLAYTKKLQKALHYLGFERGEDDRPAG